MRRGDLLTIAFQGDLGKPRRALEIQSVLFEAHPSATVLLLTREHLEPVFGHADDETMLAVNRALAVFLVWPEGPPR